MKKNIFEKNILLSLFFSALVLFSACQMFTTSWGKGLQRNQQNFLKKASASELLAFSQGAYASGNETVKAVLNLLSQKDPEELKNLPVSDKETALKLTTDATLPMEKIREIAAEVTDSGSSASPDSADKIVKKLLGNIDSFDTKAPVELLGDPVTMQNAKPSVLANAAVSVILQVAAKNGGYDKIKQNITDNGGNIDFKTQTAESIVNKMLGAGSASTEDGKALMAAVNTAKLLSGASNAEDSAGKPVTRPGIDPKAIKLLGLMPLNDILEVF